jgi:hypothetical protein
VLVLEDCDTNYQTPPFHDAVTLFDPLGKPRRGVSDINIAETIGGHRALSAAPDGRSFTVCENVGDKLTAYRANTGEPLWSLSLKDEFDAATMSSNGRVYALTSAGTIAGKETMVIDQEGHIVKRASVGGFDLALDPDRNALWLAGKNIKKCDLELNVLLELDLVKWCAVSVDLDRDGSVWIAERQHPNVRQSTNRIFKISPSGQLLKSVGLTFSPNCLRVDRSDGSVWVTGLASRLPVTKRLLDALEKRTGHLPTGQRLRDFLTRPRVEFYTLNYSQDGALQREIGRGGFSLDLDQSDGSLWIAGMDKVFHYSRQGKALARSGAMSSCQKYIVVVPASAKTR